MTTAQSEGLPIIAEGIRRLALKRRTMTVSDQQVIRLEEQIPAVDLLAWLSTAQAQTAVYWQSRDGRLECAGIGATEQIVLMPGESWQSAIGELGKRNDGQPLRWYGGGRFDLRYPEGSEEWRPFGIARFILPQCEITRRSDQYTLALNVRPSDDDDLAGLRSEGRVYPGRALAYRLTFSELPDQSGWRQMVREALATIASNATTKVVLARMLRAESELAINPWHLLRQIRDRARQAYLFGVQPHAGTIMMGASPERLFHRREQMLDTEAMAGTSYANGPAVSMVDSDKDRREHAIVTHAVQRAVKDLTEGLTMAGPVKTWQSGPVTHLRQTISGRLRSGITDSQILESLSPTPAVGGEPTAQAIRTIAALEPFDRGWYTGPIGWTSDHESEFAVGIRALLLSGRTIRLYGGAGIVEGSDPQREWDEIDAKLSLWRELFS